MCPKEFKQKSHLKTHMKNVHQTVPTNPPPGVVVQQGPASAERPTQVPPPTVIRNVGPQPIQQNNVRMVNPQQQQQPPQHMMQHHNGFAHNV